ncbi:glycosyltransferase family 4 protein [Tropicimonas sp. IMCC6043]|uniref:glycosyltransferase family 4 protein n=1 Tax=Tropicimonas sp. IMCC6043 TaxID=2510645 RepID=UPI00101CAC10|nr:glycosyltransferase family 4 protein [Tropicimonas sp. IMCC6043]RYH07473.1 glycosyltransferase [Tropicimonas sp. IMCC6043]
MKAATSPLPVPDGRVIFFIPLPDRAKGLNGAVLAAQTALEALSEACETEVVEMRYRWVHIPGTRRSLRSLLAKLTDHRASLADLGLALGRSRHVPVTLFIIAASTLGGTIRDVLSMRFALRRHKDLRIVLSSHNGDFFNPKGRLRTRLRRWQLATCSRSICLSHRLLPAPDLLLRVLPPEQADKLRVVANTVDPDMIATPDELAEKARHRGPVHVLYFSNFIPSKGYRVLGAAIRRIADAGHLESFRFTFRGTWPVPELEAEFRKELGHDILASGRVDIGGAVWERAEARRLMLDADVFCLPTSYPTEAQPRSVLEAMANGCAIVASAHAAIPDMVTSGENGLCKRDIGAEDIAAFLLTTDRETLAAQGAASRTRFDADFSRERFRQARMDAVLCR